MVEANDLPPPLLSLYLGLEEFLRVHFVAIMGSRSVGVAPRANRVDALVTESPHQKAEALLRIGLFSVGGNGLQCTAGQPRPPCS